MYVTSAASTVDEYALLIVYHKDPYVGTVSCPVIVCDMSMVARPAAMKERCVTRKGCAGGHH